MGVVDLHEGGVEEGEGLHEGDAVRVVAEHARQAGLPDLLQLVGLEAGRLVALLVEEAIAPPQPAELVAHDAGEGGAQQRPQGRPLRHARREQVHLVHARVQRLQDRDALGTR